MPNESTDAQVDAIARGQYIIFRDRESWEVKGYLPYPLDRELAGNLAGDREGKRVYPLDHRWVNALLAPSEHHDPSDTGLLNGWFMSQGMDPTSVRTFPPASPERARELMAIGGVDNALAFASMVEFLRQANQEDLDLVFQWYMELSGVYPPFIARQLVAAKAVEADALIKMTESWEGKLEVRGRKIRNALMYPDYALSDPRDEVLFDTMNGLPYASVLADGSLAVGKASDLLVEKPVQDLIEKFWPSIEDNGFVSDVELGVNLPGWELPHGMNRSFLLALQRQGMLEPGSKALNTGDSSYFHFLERPMGDAIEAAAKALWDDHSLKRSLATLLSHVKRNNGDAHFLLRWAYLTGPRHVIDMLVENGDLRRVLVSEGLRDLLDSGNPELVAFAKGLQERYGQLHREAQHRLRKLTKPRWVVDNGALVLCPGMPEAEARSILKVLGLDGESDLITQENIVGCLNHPVSTLAPVHALIEESRVENRQEQLKRFVTSPDNVIGLSQPFVEDWSLMESFSGNPKHGRMDLSWSLAATLRRSLLESDAPGEVARRVLESAAPSVFDYVASALVFLMRRADRDKVAKDVAAALRSSTQPAVAQVGLRLEELVGDTNKNGSTESSVLSTTDDAEQSTKMLSNALGVTEKLVVATQLGVPVDTLLKQKLNDSNEMEPVYESILRAMGVPETQLNVKAEKSPLVYRREDVDALMATKWAVVTDGETTRLMGFPGMTEFQAHQILNNLGLHGHCVGVGAKAIRGFIERSLGDGMGSLPVPMISQVLVSLAYNHSLEDFTFRQDPSAEMLSSGVYLMDGYLGCLPIPTAKDIEIAQEMSLKYRHLGYEADDQLAASILAFLQCTLPRMNSRVSPAGTSKAVHIARMIEYALSVEDGAEAALLSIYELHQRGLLSPGSLSRYELLASPGISSYHHRVGDAFQAIADGAFDPEQDLARTVASLREASRKGMHPRETIAGENPVSLEKDTMPKKTAHLAEQLSRPVTWLSSAGFNTSSLRPETAVGIAKRLVGCFTLSGDKISNQDLWIWLYEDRGSDVSRNAIALLCLARGGYLSDGWKEYVAGISPHHDELIRNVVAILPPAKVMDLQAMRSLFQEHGLDASMEEFGVNLTVYLRDAESRGYAPKLGAVLQGENQELKAKATTLIVREMIRHGGIETSRLDESIKYLLDHKEEAFRNAGSEIQNEVLGMSNQKSDALAETMSSGREHPHVAQAEEEKGGLAWYLTNRGLRLKTVQAPTDMRLSTRAPNVAFCQDAIPSGNSLRDDSAIHAMASYLLGCWNHRIDPDFETLLKEVGQLTQDDLAKCALALTRQGMKQGLTSPSAVAEMAKHWMSKSDIVMFNFGSQLENIAKEKSREDFKAQTVPEVSPQMEPAVLDVPGVSDPRAKLCLESAAHGINYLAATEGGCAIHQVGFGYNTIDVTKVLQRVFASNLSVEGIQHALWESLQGGSRPGAVYTTLLSLAKHGLYPSAKVTDGTLGLSPEMDKLLSNTLWCSEDAHPHPDVAEIVVDILRPYSTPDHLDVMELLTLTVEYLRSRRYDSVSASTVFGLCKPMWAVGGRFPGLFERFIDVLAGEKYLGLDTLHWMKGYPGPWGNASPERVASIRKHLANLESREQERIYSARDERRLLDLMRQPRWWMSRKDGVPTGYRHSVEVPSEAVCREILQAMPVVRMDSLGSGMGDSQWGAHKRLLVQKLHKLNLPSGAMDTLLINLQAEGFLRFAELPRGISFTADNSTSSIGGWFTPGVQEVEALVEQAVAHRRGHRFLNLPYAYVVAAHLNIAKGALGEGLASVVTQALRTPSTVSGLSFGDQRECVVALIEEAHKQGWFSDAKLTTSADVVKKDFPEVGVILWALAQPKTENATPSVTEKTKMSHTSPALTALEYMTRPPAEVETLLRQEVVHNNMTEDYAAKVRGHLVDPKVFQNALEFEVCNAIRSAVGRKNTPEFRDEVIRNATLMLKGTLRDLKYEPVNIGMVADAENLYETFYRGIHHQYQRDVLPRTVDNPHDSYKRIVEAENARLSAVFDGGISKETERVKETLQKRASSEAKDVQKMVDRENSLEGLTFQQKIAKSLGAKLDANSPPETITTGTTRGSEKDPLAQRRADNQAALSFLTAGAAMKTAAEVLKSQKQNVNKEKAGKKSMPSKVASKAVRDREEEESPEEMEEMDEDEMIPRRNLGEILLATVKEDAKTIGLRTGVRETREKLTELVTNFVNGKTIRRFEGETDDVYNARVVSQRNGVTAFFLSDVGQQAITYLLGLSFPVLEEHIPDRSVRKYGGMIAKEMRAQGGTELMQDFLEQVVYPLIGLLTTEAKNFGKMVLAPARKERVRVNHEFASTTDERAALMERLAELDRDNAAAPAAKAR